MAETPILGMFAQWPWPLRYDLFQVRTHPWIMDNNCVKDIPDPTRQSVDMARTWILGKCTLRHWPWGYGLGSTSWQIFGSWTITDTMLTDGETGSFLYIPHFVCGGGGGGVFKKLEMCRCDTDAPTGIAKLKCRTQTPRHINARGIILLKIIWLEIYLNLTCVFFWHMHLYSKYQLKMSMNDRDNERQP